MPEVFTAPGSSPSLWTPNRTSFFIDFSLAAWNTQAEHRVFTISGTVRASVLYIVNTGPCTGAAGCAIQFGATGATAEYCASQVIGNLLANRFVRAGTLCTNRAGAWASATGLFGATALADIVACTSHNLGYEITVAAATGGILEAVCFWVPISTGALVTPATGGTPV